MLPSKKAQKGARAVHEVGDTSDHAPVQYYITVTACGTADGVCLPPFIKVSSSIVVGHREYQLVCAMMLAALDGWKRLIS